MTTGRINQVTILTSTARRLANETLQVGQSCTLIGGC